MGSITNNADAQTKNTFVDSRDGRVYKTVSYFDPLLGDSLTIMAENLDYKTPNAYAYDNDDRYRKQLGLLYTWETAMKVCPDGWHLPSFKEWSSIKALIGGTDEEVAIKMKSKTGWSNNTGTNESGFSALLGGICQTMGGLLGGNFVDIRERGAWWSSSEFGEDMAYRLEISYWFEGAKISEFVKKRGLSCRCIKD